jgi:hypothetical protein
MADISQALNDSVSLKETEDDQSYIAPHFLQFYNDFYDQQLLVYDTLLYLPEQLSYIDPSDYDQCYPLGEQARLYPEQLIPSKGSKKTTKPIIKPNQCQHPKHQVYAMLVNASQFTVTPRRGRPPKGSKAMDFSETAQLKRLPKRLEPVVGVQDIHVCLTCLRRSDDDIEYNTNPIYIPPTCGRRKRCQSS